MVADIAHSSGDSLYYDYNTPGGYTFQLHSVNASTLAKISSNNWDYVVLQEQSQLPSFPPSQVQSDVFPFADSLNSKIKKNDSCTRTMFYMTWGRKNGDAGNCASYPPVCTYLGMQQRLTESYLEMGNTLNAEICPAGIAWKHLRQSNPNIELYQADESHPSLQGTYLVACSFYASIFHKSPVGLFVPAGISATVADTIQRTVLNAVSDSITTWRIDTADIKACFTTAYVSGSQYQFSNCSKNATSYYWKFGDGAISFDASPSHVYSSSGHYAVTLIAFNVCKTDSMKFSIDVLSGVNENSSDDKVKLFPSPADRYIQILCNDFMFEFVEIYDLNGRLVSTSDFANGKIYIGGLNSGCYFIRLISEKVSECKSFIKK
jgi:hypothetical protein